MSTVAPCCGHLVNDHDDGKFGCRRAVRDHQCDCALPRSHVAPKCWCGAPLGHDWASPGGTGYRDALLNHPTADTDPTEGSA